MALGFEVKSGTKPIGAAPQDQSFAASFPVKAYILVATGQTTNGAFATHSVLGLGGSDGSTEECIETASEDNVAVSSGQRGQANKVLRILDPAGPGVPLAEAIHKDFTDGIGGDGVTITWNVNDALASRIMIWMFGDDDITNVKMGRFQAKTTTGNLDITGLGFTPSADDTVIFLWGSQNGNQIPVPTPPSIQSPGAVFMFGFVAGQSADPSKLSHSNVIASEGGQAVSDTDKISDQLAFFQITYKAGNGIADGRFRVTDYLAGGFRTNWGVAASIAWNVDYLVIKGGRYAIDTGDTPVAPGNVAATGLGTTCKGVIAQSGCRPFTAAINPDAMVALGASYDDGGAKPFPMDSAWVGDEDNVGTMVADRRMNTASLLDLSVPGPVLNEVGLVHTWDVDGLTVDWSMADATQRRYGLLMMGDGAAQVPPIQCPVFANVLPSIL